MQTPAPFEYERATSVDGAIATLAKLGPDARLIAGAAQKGSKDLDATALLLTTQGQAIQTIETAADYGGSLDVILDDAR